MFHKIKSVTPMPDFSLTVQFSEGVTKNYDLNLLIEQQSIFQPLRNHPDIYRSAYVDNGGQGVAWTDDIDISCDELYHNGTQVQTPFDGLMSFGDATLIWELNESTLRKAVSYGKLVNGIDVCKFGKQWVITVDAMKREYGDPPRR